NSHRHLCVRGMNDYVLGLIRLKSKGGPYSPGLETARELRIVRVERQQQTVALRGIRFGIHPTLLPSHRPTLTPHRPKSQTDPLPNRLATRMGYATAARSEGLRETGAIPRNRAQCCLATNAATAAISGSDSLPSKDGIPPGAPPRTSFSMSAAPS